MSLNSLSKKQCEDCGCQCNTCNDSNSIHLHQEIESLKIRLIDREQEMVSMESQILNHAKKYPNGEMQALRDKLCHWQDKYERLLENYRKLQKINQGLEDKLLRIADRFENEKSILNQNVLDLNDKLTNAQKLIDEYHKENDVYKNDFNLIMQFIQNQPQSTIINIDMFPKDLQNRLNQYSSNIQDQNNETKESIRFPIATFPPTAILYDVNQFKKVEKDQSQTNISSSKLLKIFQQLEKNRINLCTNCNEKFGTKNDQSMSNGNGGSSNNLPINSNSHSKHFDNKTMII